MNYSGKPDKLHSVKDEKSHFSLKEDYNYMHHQEQSFIGSGGARLVFQSWKSKQPAKAVIIGVHGLGDHSGGLKNIVNYIVPKGFDWWGLDLRGHGRSSGIRGHVNHWSDFLDDLKSFITMVREETPSLSVFLLGHSMGGLISLEYAINNPHDLAGVIAISPAIKYTGFSPSKSLALPFVSQASPKFIFRLASDNTVLTRDSNVIKRLDSDNLRHNQISARLGKELVDSGLRVEEKAHKLRVPVLMLQGGDDIITPSQGIRSFYQSVKLTDKKYLEYPQTLHRPFDDLKRNEVMEALFSWINRKVETSIPA